MRLGGIGLATAGSIAFAALDMPARLVLQDSGMYWDYPGILLFAANAAVMALFAAAAAVTAEWLKKKDRKKEV